MRTLDFWILVAIPDLDRSVLLAAHTGALQTPREEDSPRLNERVCACIRRDEAFRLDLDEADLHSSPHTCFARLKVYTGTAWEWHNYPVKLSRYFEERWRDTAWENQSPKLVLQPKTAALHFSQVKTVAAKKVKESKEDPHLVTVGVDLNVKNLAVITVRQDGAIIETLFVSDRGLDRHRYGHLKRIAKKQWQSGAPVKGEHSNQQLWRHVRRMNEDAAQVVRLSLVQREDVPVCILSRTTPEWIASWNAAGTLGMLDSFRAARTTVSRFGLPLIPHRRPGTG